MKRPQGLVAQRLPAVLASALFSFSAAAAAGETFREVWITDRLTVGLGVGVSSLTDNHRRADNEAGFTYVGFVSKLEDSHTVAPIPEVTWWAAPELRLHLSADRVEGRTRNYNNHHSDGTVRLQGPLFEVEWIYPTLGDTLFPHLGVGVVPEDAKFEHETWWRLGWHTPEEYKAAGRTGESKNGYTRSIKVEDEIGWELSAGVSWRPHPRFQLDATLRHVWVEPECKYGTSTREEGYKHHQTGKFWLDHATFAVSGAYVF